jgi:2'-5' RNA ligase
MSSLPTQMANHWRPRPRAGHAGYYWHLLFHDQPAVHSLAALAQRKLDGLPGLDLVPMRWLHLTTLAVGLTDEVPRPTVSTMLDTARHLLADIDPIEVTLGRVLYFPEAVTLAVEPSGALQPVLTAVSIAAREAGLPGRTDTRPWLPHITMAYSNGTGPTAPIIDALGLHLPQTKITIRSASLVRQRQVGHSWQWQPVADVGLGAPRNTAR